MEDQSEQQFGDYRLVKLVGEGGFGKVHLGKHLHSETEVAIKILDARFLSREQDDFLQEARVIASLDHPSIVRLLDCGIEGETPFLAMNYAPNGTLRQRHPKGSQVPLQKVVTYVKPIASALSYAHERKLIHRDIKPENMLLGGHDEVLLGDFGIALVSSSSTSRSTRAAAGTVSYMAPEQILGKPCLTSDQYALGVVVYEWLCGRLPFLGSFAEVGQQHLYASPPSFQEQEIELAPSVEAVVRKALAKKPEERFANVQEFATALEESFLHPEMTPISVPLLPQTENDVVIPVRDAHGQQGELTPVKKTTEPLAPAILPPLVTPHRPEHRSIRLRDAIVAFCLLLLVAVVVISAARYLPLFAARSDTRAPGAQTSADPARQSTGAPTTGPGGAPTTGPGGAPTTGPGGAPTTGPGGAPTTGPGGTPPTTTPTTPPTVPPTTIPGGMPPTVPPTQSGANSNSAMFGYDTQHTHYNPNETTINTSNVSQLALAWTASIQTYAAPIYANGIVYVPDFYGKVYAFNANTGATLWVTTVSINWNNSAVAVAGGTVYVGDGDGKLDALNAKTGTILWTIQAHGSFSSSNNSPTVANGVVYIGADHGIFYAINATTGAILWTHTVADTNAVNQIDSPAVVNGVVHFSENTSVYALDAGTGALRWSISLSDPTVSSPAVVNGILYIGANKFLYALNASTGAIIWASTANQGFCSPGVVNGIVYVGSYDHNIYAFDANTGAVIWTFTTGNSMIYPSPMIIPGIVFMGSDDYTFYALDAATGARMWSFHLGSFVEVEPAVANGFVYLVGTRNNTLYAFHLP